MLGEELLAAKSPGRTEFEMEPSMTDLCEGVSTEGFFVTGLLATGGFAGVWIFATAGTLVDGDGEVLAAVVVIAGGAGVVKGGAGAGTEIATGAEAVAGIESFRRLGAGAESAT